ncbi:hypothetical protein E3N88_15440 [Mikania micrantha]|uniref:DUF1985 domain-containing protein n=1 Tax=Mikania micrantha TaxID=192012 RepID=A0A5N6NVD8_9ASTR|nr:hypothetical protein E3N88_15440 [Mikania micrantha]
MSHYDDEYTVSQILNSLKGNQTASIYIKEPNVSKQLGIIELNVDVVKMASNINQQPSSASKIRFKRPTKFQSDANQPKVKRQKVSSTVNTIKELCSSTIVKKFRSLRLRNPPKPFYSALKCLSILQKKKVIDIGFGSFLEFSCAGIPAKLGHFVVDKFHAKSMKLKLENGDIQITPELIHHICGIPCGGTSVESLVAKDKNKECYVNWRSQFVKELRPNDILRRIEETEADDMIFVLNFIILFLNSMVECIPSGKCKTDVLERIDEDVDFKSVDWCGYIYECLKKCKVGWNRDDIRSYFTGPVTFLILIYLEVTRFKQLDTPINVPSIKFWSVEMMKKREVLEIESGGFGRCELKNLSEKRVAQEECKLESMSDGSLLTMSHYNDDEYNVSQILGSLKENQTLQEEPNIFEEHEIEELNLDEVMKMASNIRQQPSKSSKDRLKKPTKSLSDIHTDQPKVKRQKEMKRQKKVKRKKASSTIKTFMDICSSTNVKKYKSLRLRNPPKPFYNALKCLSLLQKKRVIEMGFGGLLEFNCAGIPSKFGHFIADKFHAESMKLKLEKGDIQITPELIQHIFGLPCGGTSVESLVAKDKNKACFVNWRSQFVKELRPSDILRRIEETEDDDMIFVLNFIVLFLNSMVECIVSGKCKTDVVERIDEDVDVKTVDWCGYVYECLKKCKDGWNRDDIGSYFTGPLTFLILIYLEGTTFKHLDTPTNVPAIKFWSVEMMKKREILEIESGGFGRCEIKRLSEKIAAQEESEFEIIRISEDINYKLASFLEAKTELEVLFSSAFRKFPDNQILTKKKNIFHSILVKNAFKDDPPEASPSSENADQRDFDNAEQEHVKEEASVVTLIKILKHFDQVDEGNDKIEIASQVLRGPEVQDQL